MFKPRNLILFLLCSMANAEPLRVAVASNAVGVMEAVLAAYQASNSQEVTLSSGSTGQLYAQIVHGAPYDLFIAADLERPNRLLLAEKAQSVQPLLLGRLVLVGPQTSGSCQTWLQTEPTDKVAVANPQVAPYGQASVELLQTLNQWERFKPHLVYGQNVSQTWQYIQTGNAAMGLVAQSMLTDADLTDRCTWLVPESMHRPITQGMAVLNAEKTAPLVAFLQSKSAQAIFTSHGYQIP